MGSSQSFQRIGCCCNVRSSVVGDATSVLSGNQSIAKEKLWQWRLAGKEALKSWLIARSHQDPRWPLSSSFGVKSKLHPRPRSTMRTTAERDWTAVCRRHLTQYPRQKHATTPSSNSLITLSVILCVDENLKVEVLTFESVQSQGCKVAG